MTHAQDKPTTQVLVAQTGSDDACYYAPSTVADAPRRVQLLYFPTPLEKRKHRASVLGHLNHNKRLGRKVERDANRWWQQGVISLELLLKQALQPNRIPHKTNHNRWW